MPCAALSLRRVCRLSSRESFVRGTPNLSASIGKTLAPSKTRANEIRGKSETREEYLSKGALAEHFEELKVFRTNFLVCVTMRSEFDFDLVIIGARSGDCVITSSGRSSFAILKSMLEMAMKTKGCPNVIAKIAYDFFPFHLIHKHIFLLVL